MIGPCFNRILIMWDYLDKSTLLLSCFFKKHFRMLVHFYFFFLNFNIITVSCLFPSPPAWLRSDFQRPELEKRPIICDLSIIWCPWQGSAFAHYKDQKTTDQCLIFCNLLKDIFTCKNNCNFWNKTWLKELHSSVKSFNW